MCLRTPWPFGPISTLFDTLGLNHRLPSGTQVNVNPYLGVPNDFIAELLPKMIDSFLQITLDPYFPPKIPI